MITRRELLKAMGVACCLAVIPAVSHEKSYYLGKGVLYINNTPYECYNFSIEWQRLFDVVNSNGLKGRAAGISLRKSFSFTLDQFDEGNLRKLMGE